MDGTFRCMFCLMFSVHENNKVFIESNISGFAAFGADGKVKSFMDISGEATNFHKVGKLFCCLDNLVDLLTLQCVLQNLFSISVKY